MSSDRPWDDSVDSPPDPQLVAIAHACFDFAHSGDTASLRAKVEQGVPVNLTDATAALFERADLLPPAPLP